MNKNSTLPIFLFLALFIHNFYSIAQICPITTATSMVVNGDFESGNVGFTSGFSYYPSGSSMGQGQYTIGTNPNPFNSTYYANISDHNASGTGQMLIIDVNGTVGVPVWSTTISGIVANTTYFFSAWFANIERMDNSNGNLLACATCPNGVIIQNSPLMQFFVNGSSISSIIDIDDRSNNWAQYSFVWNSGTLSGIVPIAIHNLLPTGNSNDVAMDDVFFGTSCAYITNLSQYGKTSAVPPTVSLCAGGGTYKLDPQLSTVNGTIWKNSAGTTLSAARTYTVSTTGTYYLCYDTIPGCYRTDTISVVNTLSVNIGNDQNLCNPVSTTLLTGVSVPPCTVTWFLNGATIPGQTGANLFVNSVGSYKAVVKAPGCATATSNGVNITSSAATPTNANFCGPSTVNLSVSPSNSGKYKWWNSPTATNAGALLQRGGSSYNLAVSGTTNFIVYAEDTSVAKLTTGPASCASPSYSGWSENLQNDAFLFNVTTPFILDSITVPISGPASGTFNFVVKIISPASVTTTINVTLNGNGNAFYKIPLGGLSLAAGTGYEMNFTGSSKNLGICSIASGSAYPMNFSPYFSITYNKTPAGWNSFNLVGIKDWVLRTGTICARIPVVANSVCALSSDFIKLSGYQKEDKKVLSWQIQGIDFSSFILQESINGIDFTDVMNFNNKESVRSFTVSNSNSNYFRIKVGKIDGNTAFSNIVLLSEKYIPFVTIFPNPSSSGSTGNIISNFEINTIEIYDRTGKLLFSDQVDKLNEYPIDSRLTSGLYSIRIIGDNTSKVVSWLVMP